MLTAIVLVGFGALGPRPGRFADYALMVWLLMHINGVA